MGKLTNNGNVTQIRGITLYAEPGEIKVRDEILANPKITGS
jgi:hypothetical protein